MGLAGGLVTLVTRTINDLYFVVVVRELAVSPAVLAKGAALGIGATFLAALVPAGEASAAPPGAAIRRNVLEARARRVAPRAALAGLAVLAAGALLVASAGRSLAWSYAGLFAMILGAALLTPFAVIGAARAAGPGLGRLLGLPGRMAARGVVAKLSRTGVAVAALMVAVAATVGVGVMIRSFRATVVRWLETSLVADVYVSAPTLRAGRGGDSTLDPAVIARLREAPGVQAVGTYRGVRVASALGPTQLVAVGIGPDTYRQFRLLAGSPGEVWPAFQDGGAVIVSEPYAYRHGLAVGSALRLHTDHGERVFPVAGVFADYGSDQGVVMMSRRTYEASWEDRGVSSLGLVLAPGADPQATAEILRARAGPGQDLMIRSNRALREASLEIFDRTFAITAVLRVLATGVAVIGVLSALMALQLERARELGVLRAQGLTPREVWRLMLAESGLLGGIAGVLAVPVGIGLALVLIRVINRRAFGWSIETTVPADVLLQAVGLAVLAALVAGAYPGLAHGADAARAGAPGGVTGREATRRPGAGLLLGVLATVAVAGRRPGARHPPGRRRVAAAEPRRDAVRGRGARGDEHRGLRAGPRPASLRVSGGPRPAPGVSHGVVVLDREPPRRGGRGRPAFRIPADVLPHGARPGGGAAALGLGRARRVHGAPRGDRRGCGPVPRA